MRLLSGTASLCFATLTSLVAFGAHPGSAASAGAAREAAGKAAEAAKAGHQMYVIECRIANKTDDGEETECCAPKISVPEGRPASISTRTQTPFVTAIQVDGKQETPRIVVLEEGLSAELSVHRDHDGLVSLDATVHNSKIVEVNKKHGHQAFRHETHTVRINECVALGELLTVDLEGPEGRQTAQFVVSLPGKKPHWPVAQTPKTASRPKGPGYAQPK